MACVLLGVAFEEGRNAFCEWYDLSENPYEEKTEAHAEWAEGWSYASDAWLSEQYDEWLSEQY
jgi:hypothetical protein